MKKNVSEFNLYKKNITIHRKLWKVYFFTLCIGLITIYIRG